jgi:transposase
LRGWSHVRSRKGGRYPDELRERAVRMVFDRAHEYPSQRKAIESIAEKLSLNRETLRGWVRRAEVDGGRRPGVTTDERERMRELERENRELRRANEMVGSTGVPGPVRLDRRRPGFCAAFFDH